MLEARAEQSASGPENKHTPALDGVRGLAILAVVAGHLLTSNNIANSHAVQLLLNVRDQLWIGVTLFFSLSGFLITGILYDTLGAQNYFQAFYARRVLRIFPLYYGFLGVLLVLTPVLHLNWHGQAWRLWTYTGNIPFNSSWPPNPASYINVGHFWSLAVEEQFYLIWPLLVFSLRSWRRIFIATLLGSVIALALRSVLYFPLNHSLPYCMDSILLGGALALLLRSRYQETTMRWAPWAFVVAAAITLGFVVSDPTLTWASNRLFSSLGMTVISLGTTALVACALRPRSTIERIMQIWPLRFLGTYSYGLYVYHYSVDAALTGRFRQALLAHGANKFVAIMGAALPIAIISIALALLSYQLYEKYFLRMKRYFPYRKAIQTAKLAHQ